MIYDMFTAIVKLCSLIRIKSRVSRAYSATKGHYYERWRSVDLLYLRKKKKVKTRQEFKRVTICIVCMHSVL